MALTRSFAVATAGDASGTVLTSGSFDSTGFKHIVVFAKHEGAPTTITLGDNKSSTIGGLTKVNHSNNSVSAQLFHGAIGTPGTSHTVTMTLAAARTFREVKVWLIAADGSGAELDVAAAGGQGTGTAADAGSLVTTAAAISIMGVGQDTGARTYTPSAGWNEDSDVNDNFGASRSDASGTHDPACTISSSSDWIAVAASFREVGAAAGQPYRKRTGGVPGMGQRNVW